MTCNKKYCKGVPEDGKKRCPKCLGRSRSKYRERKLKKLCIVEGCSEPLDKGVRCKKHAHLVCVANIANYHRKQESWTS